MNKAIAYDENLDLTPFMSKGKVRSPFSSSLFLINLITDELLCRLDTSTSCTQSSHTLVEVPTQGITTPISKITTDDGMR